ncbi:putative protein N(5)-glutamine methyltransferase [Streptomyces iconiensis]|uniref:peptide chain release factor N(5)-glutamine methyltransferase n=1 Tax=Streptomyces iconiensis TaxID=1384038 RepID=A0ABT7A7X9_9ACTN|nr:putative protein N(5)-glutamine methyltransferase [Streptomyces iconiensis]MDJ1137437.1 putative protein N(5)-glutamine methyltransferase [Streptomyces iconiensis]
MRPDASPSLPPSSAHAPSASASASAFPPAAPPDSLVARLRAAGCVFAEDEARLLVATARAPAELAAMTERRVSGLPLEHVLGWAEFAGLRIAVDTGVFVPRRRTEFLVRCAVALAPAPPAAPVVLDLCCGTGAVGAAVLDALGGRGVLHAADVDPAAVRCARRNLDGLGGHVHEGDLFDALPGSLRGRIDILAANVPYVPTGDIPLLPPEARDHEPRTALDGGPDGLALLRRVAAAALPWLSPTATLLTETTPHQAPAATHLLTACGYTSRTITDDDLEATVVTATPASRS